MIADKRLMAKLEELSPLIGQTSLRKLNVDGVNCYAKLEFNNFSGSIKDRAVYNILHESIRLGQVNSKTMLIESSSGNFAISMASMCNYLGLRFIAVLDPNVNKQYEDLLRLLAYKVIKVEERDETGGYLLNRIRTVKAICTRDRSIFWTDQYDNPNNYFAYYHGLGPELGRQLGSLDYAFIAVSTCGTITGLSKSLKELFPQIKIVGVDIEGSLVFQNEPKRRHISGLGSSKRPDVIDKAVIHESVVLSHIEILNGCHDLLRQHSLFAGASSGAMFAAVKDYVQNGHIYSGSDVLFLCCDRGNAYQDTIYNEAWGEKIRQMDLVSQ